MVGEEDASASTPRRTIWRSSSWSSPCDNLGDERNGRVDSGGNIGDNNGHSQRFPVALTPRTHHNFKTRACLPPLQPLSIARRSLDEWPKAGSDDVGEWPQAPITPGGREELGKSGDGVKLDLSTVIVDKNGGLVKREKIACFDKVCSKVAKHLYCGGDVVARDRDILKKNGISHILNCVGFVCPEYFKADFVYRTLWLQDNPSEDITSILYDVFDYFEDVKEQEGRVFVHCCQGVSRSTSLVIAYLMWREGRSFDDAFKFVKAARGIADPNMGFACQLLQCQKRVHAFPLSPTSLLRMYRIAPHSPYDPLHLVPKILNEPAPSSLDSRGAFIIHVPSAIYVWIGKNCKEAMERDAIGAAGQIVRYERIKGPTILMMKEGEEPTYFWDVFSTISPLMDEFCNVVEIRKSSVKICPGKRKVDEYNVDFEIFQKAVIGGFVPPLASSETELETHLPVRESSWSALRQKFASAYMKDIVSSPKLSFSRVFSDSMLMIGTEYDFEVKPSQQSPEVATLSSPTSSSSSPLCLSPESMSLNSGNDSKDHVELVVASPSHVLCSDPSSALSSFSNVDLRPPKSSRRDLANNPAAIDMNFTSQPAAQSVPSASKKLALSLAERRGSLSKTLSLPGLADNTRVQISENAIQSKGCTQNRERNINQESTLQFSSEGVPGADSSRNELAFVVEVFEPLGGFYSGEGQETNINQKNTLRVCSSGGPSADTRPDEVASDEPFRGYHSGGLEMTNGIVENDSLDSNPKRPSICHWPSFKKVSTFGSSCLHSEAALLFCSPSADLSEKVDTIVYFWVGRSFHHGQGHNLDSGGYIVGSEEVDLKQVQSYICTRMGLAEDTILKIVKQDEESEEFCALLSSL